MKLILVTVLFTFIVLAATESIVEPIKTGKSLRCPDFCTELYNPVCAMSFSCTALFGNPCKLDAWNCKTVRREEIFYPADISNCRHLNGFNSIQCRPNL